MGADEKLIDAEHLARTGAPSGAVEHAHEVEPYPRTFQDILRDLRGIKLVSDEDRAARPKPQAKRVSASLEKPVRQGVQENFEDGLRRDPDKHKRWVALLDGNEHQLEAVQAQARAMDVDLTIIVDLIHVAGYVWGAAKALRPERSVLSIKSECLSKIIPLGERHLRLAVREFIRHYHEERPHQGIGNRLIEPAIAANGNGSIRCRERLGGVLRFYHRDAA